MRPISRNRDACPLFLPAYFLGFSYREAMDLIRPKPDRRPWWVTLPIAMVSSDMREFWAPRGNAVRLVEDSQKLEVSKTSDTVSNWASYFKRFISYGHRANVTKMSHARSDDSGGPDHADCLGQVDRLLRSPLLNGSEALCKLLQYLAHHTLNSPADHLRNTKSAPKCLGVRPISTPKLIPASGCRWGACAPS